MTLHHPFAGTSGDLNRRSLLQQLLRGLRVRPRRAGTDRVGPPSRDRGREQRQLARMERKLGDDTPQLASMFATFNRLAAGETVSGIEELPPPARRPRPRPVHMAVLVSLAAVAALCYALSTQVHAAVRPCPAAGTTVPAAIASAAAVSAPASTAVNTAALDGSGSAARPGASAGVPAPSCSAYPASK